LIRTGKPEPKLYDLIAEIKIKKLIFFPTRGKRAN